jgi:hypothetical protein
LSALPDLWPADDEGEAVEPVKRSCAFLLKHFEHVQVFAQRRTRDGSTETVAWGEGNYYARFGQVRQWVIGEEAAVKHRATE